jgi:CRP-like cAMP-binding protein
MAKSSFTSYTYEVFRQENGRWTVDLACTNRQEAIARSEVLLKANKYEAVKVTQENEATGKIEILVEESTGRKSGKIIKIAPIEDAPVCKELLDYYQFDSRRTIGRLMRQYLDDQFLTSLELLFDLGRMNSLERNDTLLVKAMQRVGSLQAKSVGTKPHERVDVLYRDFSQIKDRARDSRDNQKYSDILKAEGMSALISNVTETITPENHDQFILGALASTVSEGRDWDSKLEILINLAEPETDEKALAYLDDAIAEILDAPSAVNELIGRQKDATAAYRMLIHLSVGRAQVPDYLRSCLEHLNLLMAEKNLPVSKSILLDRVCRGLKSVNPLTKEGFEADKAAFSTLIRYTIGLAGLEGDKDMAEAVVLRAKSLMGDEGADLPIDQTIGNVLNFFPNRAIKLGFLLDLSRTGLMKTYATVILTSLLGLVEQLKNLSSLFPSETSTELIIASVDALREKLGMGGIPEDMQKSFASSLDRLVKEREAADAASKNKNLAEYFAIDEEKEMMLKVPSVPKNASSGDILFNEGDNGTEAYIVKKGEVEIFRKLGNREIVLATLGPGSIIGEMSLIDNQPRMASGRALTNTELLTISQKNLHYRLEKVESNDQVLRRLLDVLVERARGYVRTAE